MAARSFATGYNPRPGASEVSTRSKLLVMAAAAALLLVVAYILGIGLPAPGTDRPSTPQPSHALVSGASAPASLDAVRREAVPPRDSASDQAASPHPSEPGSTEPPRNGPGRIVISAIDAETRKPVGRFYVRAIDDVKINELHSSLGKPTLSISLLPAMYELQVGAPGYEPTALPAARVPPGETVTLDPV